MDVMIGGMIFFIFAILLGSLIGIGMYVLMSLGLMGLLKTCGEKSPALAFVPYLNTYYLGRVGSKDPSKFSKLGIALVILQVAVSIVSGIMGFTVSLIENTGADEIFIIFPTMLAIFVSLAYLVIYYIAMSRIFLKYSENGVIFTVLNIIFGGGLLGVIFLFIIRNNKPVVRPQNV